MKIILHNETYWPHKHFQVCCRSKPKKQKLTI